MVKIKKLNAFEALRYKSLTLNRYKNLLLNSDDEKVISIGAESDDGQILGLILAYNYRIPNSEGSLWNLCSIFVSEKIRRNGIGEQLFSSLIDEIKVFEKLKYNDKKHLTKIIFQGVLREKAEENSALFFTKQGFEKIERIAKIFTYSCDKIAELPFVKASICKQLISIDKFILLSPKQLSKDMIDEMKKNKGKWYPEFVSPFIGMDSFNNDCSVFAVDKLSGNVAGWVTAMDVNNNTNILYRTFFARKEFRQDNVGMLVFSQAVMNHIRLYYDRKVMSSIPLENQVSMKFNDLFFRGMHDHVSYEIFAEYFLNK